MRRGLERTCGLCRPGVTGERAAAALGNGSRITFALWAAAPFPGDYPAAVRACVRADGDMDTTAAITGSIVATRTGTAGIPAHWLAGREALPSWFG